MEPEPNFVFDTYWKFAHERQQIFFRRLRTPGWPWTNDPILRHFRFTNAYRASDRVTQYLIREVQYRGDRPQSASELFFRTILFKLFNRIETWEAIEARVGPVSWEGTEVDSILQVLGSRLDTGHRIYSAAYIMPSPPLGLRRKHENHLSLLAQMMTDGAPQLLESANSLRSVFDTLLSYPGLGPFLAFQYAIDLNYSPFLDFEERDLVIAGPGARDGIAKCFGSTGGMSAEDIVYWTTERQEREFNKRGFQFSNLFGRRLQPIDCQNIYCEVSKYTRASHPDILGLSGRKRIKQSFRPTDRALPEPMYPPKWNLNVRTPFCSDSRND